MFYAANTALIKYNFLFIYSFFYWSFSFLHELMRCDVHSFPRALRVQELMSPAGILGTLWNQKQRTRHSACFSVTVFNSQLAVTTNLVATHFACKACRNFLNLVMCNSDILNTSRKSTVCSHFALHQQHNKLPLLCSDCCGDGEQGSRMIWSVTVATSFHFNYNVPSIPLALRSSLLAPSLCWRWGCAALPLSLPRDALGGGMLLSHASHAHSFVWYAAPPDNTFTIKGPRQRRTIKLLFLSLPPVCALFCNQPNIQGQ